MPLLKNPQKSNLTLRSPFGFDGQLLGFDKISRYHYPFTLGDAVKAARDFEEKLSEHKKTGNVLDTLRDQVKVEEITKSSTERLVEAYKVQPGAESRMKSAKKEADNLAARLTKLHLYLEYAECIRTLEKLIIEADARWLTNSISEHMEKFKAREESAKYYVKWHNHDIPTPFTYGILVITIVGIPFALVVGISYIIAKSSMNKIGKMLDTLQIAKNIVEGLRDADSPET